VVATRIREFTAAEINTLERDGAMKISSNGADFDISREDVEVLHEDIQGWLVESDGSITVALDTELNDELIDEGFAREFVNRVQNMRKDSGFEVTDRIKIYHRSSERLSKALEHKSSYIKQETLALEMMPLSSNSGAKPQEADINGEPATIAVEKV